MPEETFMSSSIPYSDNPGDESTPLLNSDVAAQRPHWPRNRELGWLMPYGLKYPPPVLPRPLRGLQADLDSAWMELERQQVIANRVNLLTSTMALLITSSGGITTAMASNKNVRVWTTVMGMLTTIAGTVMGGIRAMGQPRRAEDRVRRLERIIDHIGRMYYTVGPDDNSSHEQAIEQTWKMIDEEEDRTELEERKAGSFGYRIQAPPLSSSSVPQTTSQPLPESGPLNDMSGSKQEFIRPRLKARRASTLLGKHFSSS
ncbi:hypothetical protein PTTG_27862 [Puccinia triticina 1-1 BBBD Race 1]|uniref:SLATT_fungal domain-containing protein n=2 Tax=Puccinia triticina TaxID=208348 RepID=A0A180GH83_PUCT1|nr:uncharacterized protein PtA15_7A806 [Puccinia triticina]OAV91829.1 hypothetical protein PTTG_27862 [Puccinia triticina 1-1 BBBD Race 1]WAQ87076.1 hypothetical protein PtA15_7A806 [Puccinia triticina]WAR56933.1 hypothetical protein PtB15_7B786 [Puccinia triticina]